MSRRLLTASRIGGTWRYCSGMVTLLYVLGATFAEGAPCGPFDGERLVEGQIAKPALIIALERHQLWLKDHPDRLFGLYEPGLFEEEDALRANLCGADLRGLNSTSVGGLALRGAILTRADLRDANFFADDLQGVRFAGANLENADLAGSSLDRADFRSASLKSADLGQATLTDARMDEADLEGAVFDIRPDALPRFWSFCVARNIESLRYNLFPDALYALRARMIEAGRGDLARSLTHAIEKSRTRIMWRRGEYGDATLRAVFWDWPTRYGLAPWRALLILLALIPFFGCLYFFGINPDRPLLIRVAPGDGVTPESQKVMVPVVKRDVGSAILALRFSLVSAFAVGFREVDVGSWLARLQGTEEMIVARGWVRTASGLQSLLSLILMASWLLTWFGSAT
jgi:hypothetical protein